MKLLNYLSLAAMSAAGIIASPVAVPTNVASLDAPAGTLSRRVGSLTFFQITRIGNTANCEFFVGTSFSPTEGPLVGNCVGARDIKSKINNAMYSIACNSAVSQCQVGVFVPWVGYQFANVEIQVAQARGLPKPLNP